MYGKFVIIFRMIFKVTPYCVTIRFLKMEINYHSSAFAFCLVHNLNKSLFRCQHPTYWNRYTMSTRYFRNFVGKESIEKLNCQSRKKNLFWKSKQKITVALSSFTVNFMWQVIHLNHLLYDPICCDECVKQKKRFLKIHLVRADDCHLSE